MGCRAIESAGSNGRKAAGRRRRPRSDQGAASWRRGTEQGSTVPAAPGAAHANPGRAQRFAQPNAAVPRSPCEDCRTRARTGGDRPPAAPRARRETRLGQRSCSARVYRADITAQRLSVPGRDTARARLHHDRGAGARAHPLHATRGPQHAVAFSNSGGHRHASVCRPRRRARSATSLQDLLQ